MAYSFAQLEGLWEQAGGSHALAPVMAAIALAESGGDPNVTGKAGEKGLWQINPATWGSLATYNPLGNAKAAVHVAASPKGLANWTTYNDGAYKAHLSSAAAAQVPAGGKPIPQPGGGFNPPIPPNGPVGNPSAPGASGGGLVGWISGVIGDVGTVIGDLNPLSSISDVAQAIVGLAQPFIKAGEAIDWFFVPSHWIRIISGVGGTIMTTAGVWELAHTGEDRPAALPVGIGLTGFGLVLLFIAFHNLDPSIKTVGELLADVQGKTQAGLQATVSPAAAVTAAGG